MKGNMSSREDQEEFLLDDLDQFELSEHSDQLSTYQEQPNSSNALKRLACKIWNGPDIPLDEPPTWQLRWKGTLKIDEFPECVFRKRISSRSTRHVLLALYCTVWLGIIFSILHPHILSVPYSISPNGKRQIIVPLECNDYYSWAGPNNECGLDGTLCHAFEQSTEEAIIRCPALCDQGGYVYAAITVGDNRVKYKGYQIGGGTLENNKDSETLTKPYRADSFPCSAAVHAGLISPLWGGTVRIAQNGPQNTFPSTLGAHDTGYSVPFNSFFPNSFVFKSLDDYQVHHAYDPRALVVLWNIICGLPVWYLYESVIGYWIITLVGYWTLILALDPPLLVDPSDPVTFYSLFSIAFQRLLPLCFILYVMWKAAVKRTLGGEKFSPLLKVILWYPTFWLGVMNNVTFDRLPVDRLTLKDLKEEAGALTAVASIISTILVCAVVQAYAIWKSGRFRKFFKIYIAMICGIVFLAKLPGLNLRIHHYILGILLAPGCATRGFSAYAFQGILIGLILSGVARWDFASIVETDFALLRGEAGARPLPPRFVHNETQPHVIQWQDTGNQTQKNEDKFDGYSLLMNDVEIYVGNSTNFDFDQYFEEHHQWQELLRNALDANETTNLYMRVAKASTNFPIDDRSDYTNAAVLEWPQGIWHQEAPGVS